MNCIIPFPFLSGPDWFYLSIFHPLLQNGFFGDADIDRLKLADSYINGTQVQVKV